MPFYVYLIQSLKDKSYYIGQTSNINERLNQHNRGKVRSTKNRVPFKLIGFETYKTREEARYREYKLKRHSGRRKNFIRELHKRAEKLTDPESVRGKK